MLKHCPQITHQFMIFEILGSMSCVVAPNWLVSRYQGFEVSIFRPQKKEEIVEQLRVTYLEENFVHTDAIDSNTFIKWRTTGSLDSFRTIIQKKD
jgi:hypothetical protein